MWSWLIFIWVYYLIFLGRSKRVTHWIRTIPALIIFGHLCTIVLVISRYTRNNLIMVMDLTESRQCPWWTPIILLSEKRHYLNNRHISVAAAVGLFARRHVCGACLQRRLVICPDPDVGFKLCRRLRRRYTLEPPLGQCVVSWPVLVLTEAVGYLPCRAGP